MRRSDVERGGPEVGPRPRHDGSPVAV